MSKPEQLYGPGSSILVTGASSGIGAGLAVHLAGYGGRIALMARRRERLEQVAADVRAHGGTPLVLEGDVTDAADVGRCAAELEREQGPVDVAFLNAGAGDFISFRTFDAARVRQMFDVNVMGVVHWMGALAAGMVERGRGTIAVTSSLAADRGLPRSAPYSASKAAVSTLLDGYRADAARHGVTLVLIEPGFVKSEMTDRNKFKMPFLLPTEDAVRVISAGVARGERRIRFPWQLSAASRLLRHVPDGLFDTVGTLAFFRKADKARG